MKKSYLIMAAIASLALVSCSNEEFVGELDQGPNGNQAGAILFASNAGRITRSYEGAAAAEQLNYAFVVGGYKGEESVATSVVFDNYNVAYPQTPSVSNTTGWEYVGLNVNPLAAIYVAPGQGQDPDKQTIKYWDYSQNQYDFIAYSLGNGDNGTKATATRITPSTAADKDNGGAYTLTGTTAQLKTVHIADLVTVKNADYNKVVSITFRKLAAKVRMAIYETVPGYSVKDVKFYPSDAAISNGATSETATLYTPSATPLPTAGTYTVYFPTVNKQKVDNTANDYNTDANNAHVAFTTSTSTSTTQTFGEMSGDLANHTLATSEKYEYKGLNDGAAQNPTAYSADTKFLIGRTSNNATFAGTYPYYQDVLPYEDGTSLTLKVDYTLISTDGTGETIKVVGAKAVVPAIYAQWKPGYAYTYIFKISDNTNGYTSQIEGNKLAGLHAITFDAVVLETTDNNQETVTTVATPSITTYQADPHVNASGNDEYVAGTVYAMVMDGGTLITDLNSNTKPAQLFSLSRAATEAEVMDALTMYTDLTDGGAYTGLNGLVLTPGTIDNAIADEDIPGPDGNLIEVADGAASKLTVAAGTTYAYVYTVTKATTTPNQYRPVRVEANASVSGLYILENGQYTVASNNVPGTTYYAKYTQDNSTYAVKVIKVAQ